MNVMHICQSSINEAGKKLISVVVLTVAVYIICK